MVTDRRTDGHPHTYKLSTVTVAKGLITVLSARLTPKSNNVNDVMTGTSPVLSEPSQSLPIILRM